MQNLVLPVDQFEYWEKNTPDHVFLRQPRNDVWHTWTWKQSGETIRKIAAYLKRNYPAGSNIAILSKNCAEWIMADFAIWMAGHVSVPIYPTLSAHTIRLILEHCEAKAIFLGKLDDYKSQQPGIPATVDRISFSVYGIHEGKHWEEIVNEESPDYSLNKPIASALATIKYTSGTTGLPKGVMISFGAFAFALQKGLEGFDLRAKQHRFFSYLPLSHIAERNLVELGALYSGGSISFSESLEKFPQNLMDVQPTIFLAVPRIWTKFQEKILEKMPQQKLDKLLRIPLINSLVKNAIKKKLGVSKADWILTGAAPMPKTLLEWFHKLGITIHEVYGMTENLALSHINLHKIKFGTVGQAWIGIETRLTEEGEIQTKHSGHMSGYYKEPEQTHEAFTEDGFLRTGDIGELDDEGFLRITGRIKDQFKTDKGKYISPAPIEMELQRNPDIEQVCVVGNGIPQPIALVVLSIQGKAKNENEIIESLSTTIAEINPGLDAHERLETAVIMKTDWTIENGLLTPTLKIKRNEVEKIHMPHYPRWYHQEGLVVWE